MTLMVEAPNPATQPARIGHVAAAHARGAIKIYGSGDTRVTALNDVDVEFDTCQLQGSNDRCNVGASV